MCPEMKCPLHPVLEMEPEKKSKLAWPTDIDDEAMKNQNERTINFWTNMNTNPLESE